MNDYKMEIIISGDQKFDPDFLTKKLNIIPDITWRIGDNIGRSSLLRHVNAWVLSVNYTENDDVSMVLNGLFEKLKPVEASVINYLNSSKDFEFEISIAIYVEDTTPALNFSPEIISKLALFNASLDIDVILI